MDYKIRSSDKRILVIGCSGSGKSTIARFLSEKYDLPAVHLDVHFWNPGWIMTARDEWRKKIERLAAQDEWIMDGNFASSFDIRFPRADRIIIFKLPRLLCLYRAITRIFKYNKKKRRPDMADGCDEKFDLTFYKYIWTFGSKEYPTIIENIKKHRCKKKIIFLKSKKSIERFFRANS